MHDQQKQQSVVQSKLEISSKTSSTKKPFKCQKCNSEFKIKESLISHMRRHEGIKPFECKECGKRFTTKSSHSAHSKVHLKGENCFECDICNRKVHFFKQNFSFSHFSFRKSI